MSCLFSIEDVRAIQRRTLVSLGRYRRLSDYVASTLDFQRRNLLQRGVVTEDDLRDQPHGPWHGVPAMGVLYAHLNRLHRDHEETMRFVTSAPAASLVHLTNLWLEGGTALRFGANGAGLAEIANNLDEAFHAFQTDVYDHPTAEAALAASVLALDEVRGTVVCAVDTERSSELYLDRAASVMRTARATLLPMMLAQGRVGARPGYASMDLPELTAHLTAMGYAVRVVEVGLQFEARLYTTLEWAWHVAHGESTPALDESPAGAGHPLIVVQIPRGLTMPPALSSVLLRDEAGFLRAVRDDPKLFETFRSWIEGYLPDELVETDGRPDKDIVGLCAQPERRLARSRRG